jgi:putative redox protein
MVAVSADWDANNPELWVDDGAGNVIVNCVATDVKGNHLLIGRSQQYTTPGQVLLSGLAGCICLGVARILRQKRQQVQHVEVMVTGHQPEEYPKPFHTMEVLVKVIGEQVDPRIVESTIHTVHEKYCTVGVTLENGCEINTHYQINAPSEPLQAEGD